MMFEFVQASSFVATGADVTAMKRGGSMMRSGRAGGVR